MFALTQVPQFVCRLSLDDKKKLAAEERKELATEQLRFEERVASLKAIERAIFIAEAGKIGLYSGGLCWIRLLDETELLAKYTGPGWDHWYYRWQMRVRWINKDGRVSKVSRLLRCSGLTDARPAKDMTRAEKRSAVAKAKGGVA